MGMCLAWAGRAALRWLAICVVLVTAAAANAADMVPYLQASSATSVYVTWKSSVAGAPVVEYGTATGSIGLQTTGTSQSLATNYFFHGVKLTDLAPDTTYQYRIRLGAQVSPVYRFRTQSPSSKTTGKFRILFVGDHQIRDQDRHLRLMTAARAKLEAEYGRPIEEVLNLIVNDGDQVDVGTLDHYENLHFAQSAPMSKNVPIQTTLGNHETYYDPGLVNWKAHFFHGTIAYKTHQPGPDERYYANHVGRVLFIHMDSEAPNATQKAWIQSVVDTAASDPEVDWIISVLHRPYQAEQYVGDISTWLRAEIMPILSSTRKHVLNVAGHHHLYARGQTRDFPTYHMISGGTAWDQFWGQSTERDFDDVQKTIANWTWQLVEIDNETKEMTVRSFSEAHPKLGFVYQSRQTDSFHRNLNHGAPGKPAITDSLGTPGAPTTVLLPFTFHSSPFTSSFDEQLNSTQFQIARDVTFQSLVLDKLRDVENLYGDTGAPLYEPIDINAGLDILSFEVASRALPNGTYFVRLRHRDTNVEWSAWSETKSFTVQGSTSGSPAITLVKKAYRPAEPVVVTHVNGTGNPLDWIGIYVKGQTPGGVGSTQYKYVSGPNGQASFAGLAPGVEYYAAFFTNDSYTEIAPRVPFYVGNIPTVLVNKTAFGVGESVVFTWTGAPGKPTDWLGIYRIGEVPGSANSTQWKYITTTSGTATFENLPKGYYYATFMVNDGYFEIIERITFSVGERIATLSMSDTALDIGEDYSLTFSSGPGIPKDYLGIFRIGATPGVDKLVTYYYVGGRAAGTIDVTEDLPEGSYFVALFTNDSYTEVSNRVDFTVGNATLPAPKPVLSANKAQYLDTEAVTVTWGNTPGGATDWVGIYKAGQSPGPVPATQWAYLPGKTGSKTFTALPAGDYYVALFINDGYTEIAPRVPFKVVKLGDINGDGRVDLLDRDAQRAAMGSCFGSARYVIAANFDADACITQNDYKLWYAIYRKQ